MGSSLRQLDDRKNLKGWVVIKHKRPGGHWALNYGPTINGVGWGFDYVSRATVFLSVSSAMKAGRRLEDRKHILVRPVKSVAMLGPYAEASGRLGWRARTKPDRKWKEIASDWEFSANEIEARAQEELQRAKRLRKCAATLRASDVSDLTK